MLHVMQISRRRILSFAFALRGMQCDCASCARELQDGAHCSSGWRVREDVHRGWLAPRAASRLGASRSRSSGGWRPREGSDLLQAGTAFKLRSEAYLLESCAESSSRRSPHFSYNSENTLQTQLLLRSAPFLPRTSLRLRTTQRE